MKGAIGLKRENSSVGRGLIITLLVFAVLLGGGFAVIDRVGKKADSAEIEMVREAVRSAALTCYAVEGSYPDDPQYLIRYGLDYDEDRYIISYDAFASNIMPDISVLEKGAAR